MRGRGGAKMKDGGLKLLTARDIKKWKPCWFADGMGHEFYALAETLPPSFSPLTALESLRTVIDWEDMVWLMAQWTARHHPRRLVWWLTDVVGCAVRRDCTVQRDCADAEVVAAKSCLTTARKLALGKVSRASARKVLTSAESSAVDLAYTPLYIHDVRVCSENVLRVTLDLARGRFRRAVIRVAELLEATVDLTVDLPILMCEEEEERAWVLDRLAFFLSSNWGTCRRVSL